MKGHAFFQGEIITLTKLKKHLIFQNHSANFNQTWHKASFGEGDSSLFEWRATSFSKGIYDNALTKYIVEI